MPTYDWHTWVKLKEVGQSTRTFVGEAANDAKGNVVDVAGWLGSIRHVVQDCFLSAAASTGTFLRKSMSETKEKVAIGKTKFEEVICV